MSSPWTGHFASDAAARWKQPSIPKTKPSLNERPNELRARNAREAPVLSICRLNSKIRIKR